MLQIDFYNNRNVRKILEDKCNIMIHENRRRYRYNQYKIEGKVVIFASDLCEILYSLNPCPKNILRIDLNKTSRKAKKNYNDIIEDFFKTAVLMMLRTNEHGDGDTLHVLISELFKNPQNEHIPPKFKKNIKQMLNIINIIVDDINQYNINNDTVISLKNNTAKLELEKLNVYTQITLLYTLVKKINMPVSLVVNAKISTELNVIIELFLKIMKTVIANPNNEFLQLTMYSIIYKIMDYYGEDFSKFIKNIINEGSTYYSLVLNYSNLLLNVYEQKILDIFKCIVQFIKNCYFKKYNMYSIIGIIGDLSFESNFIGIYTAFNDNGLLEYEDVINLLIGKINNKLDKIDKVEDLLLKFNNRKLEIIYYAMRGKVDKLDTIISKRIKLTEDEFSYILVTLHPKLIHQCILGSNEFTQDIIKKFYRRSNYMKYFFHNELTINPHLWVDYMYTLYDMIFQTNYVPFPEELGVFLNLKIDSDTNYQTYRFGTPEYDIKWGRLEKYARDRRFEEITNKLIELGCTVTLDIFECIIRSNIKISEQNVKRFDFINILDSEQLINLILMHYYDISHFAYKFNIKCYEDFIKTRQSFRHYELLEKYVKPTKETLDFIENYEYKYSISSKIMRLINTSYEKNKKD